MRTQYRLLDLDTGRTNLELEDTYIVAVSLQYEDASYATDQPGTWEDTYSSCDTYSSRHIQQQYLELEDTYIQVLLIYIIYEVRHIQQQTHTAAVRGPREDTYIGT